MIRPAHCRLRILRARSAAGFTLFELILVIVLVALFSGILFGRFIGYQEMAEKAAMEQTAGAVRSALAIQSAALIARGRAGDIRGLADMNPMDLLRDRQQNYAGAFFDPAPGDIPPGSWYFDLRHKELVYLVEHGTHFMPGPDGAKTVRYRVGLVYNEEIPGAAPVAPKRELGGVTLYEVNQYSWKIE